MPTPRPKIIRTYAQWLEALPLVQRLVVKEMTQDELDLAGALVFARPVLTIDQAQAVHDGKVVPSLRTPVRLDSGAPCVKLRGKWAPFSITSDWEAFGLLLTKLPISYSTHESEDDDGNPRFWHSAQTAFSGTLVQAFADDPRLILAHCAALILQHPVFSR